MRLSVFLLHTIIAFVYEDVDIQNDSGTNMDKLTCTQARLRAKILIQNDIGLTPNALTKILNDYILKNEPVIRRHALLCAGLKLRMKLCLFNLAPATFTEAQ